MTEKHKEQPGYDYCLLTGTSPILLTVPRHSQIGIAVSDDDLGSYQMPSHPLELPVVFAQDSIAGVEPVDLEPIPHSVI